MPPSLSPPPPLSLERQAMPDITNAFASSSAGTTNNSTAPGILGGDNAMIAATANAATTLRPERANRTPGRGFIGHRHRGKATPIGRLSPRAASSVTQAPSILSLLHRLERPFKHTQVLDSRLAASFRQPVKPASSLRSKEQHLGFDFRGGPRGEHADIPGGAMGHGVLVFAIGMVLLLAGAGLRWWSFHPGYAGGLPAMIGIGVIYRNWVGLARFALSCLAIILWRIHIEETALVRRAATPTAATPSTTNDSCPASGEAVFRYRPAPEIDREPARECRKSSQGVATPRSPRTRATPRRA